MADDYIRREDTVDEINANANDLEQNGCIPFAQGARAMAIVVEQMPPADVAPVVHGKWIDHDGNKVQLNEHGETCGTCFCSQCGEWLVASDEYAVKGYFCPNCGAKMDGDECSWFEPIEDHTQLKYNPIRPIKYPSTERSFLRDESCRSSVIGNDNDKILGIFCYDAKT